MHTHTHTDVRLDDMDVKHQTLHASLRKRLSRNAVICCTPYDLHGNGSVSHSSINVAI